MQGLGRWFHQLCKHEDLNLIPQTQVKKSVVVCASKVEAKVWSC